MKDKPKAKIIGADGNIFNILGIASKALNENKQEQEAKEMFERATKSKSYEEAVSVILEYIEPVSLNTQSENDMTFY